MIRLPAGERYEIWRGEFVKRQGVPRQPPKNTPARRYATRRMMFRRMKRAHDTVWQTTGEGRVRPRHAHANRYETMPPECMPTAAQQSHHIK